MTSKSFQIIFEEANGHTYSATFDIAIGLDCKGKYVDVKGEVHNMNKWTRKVHPDSTSLNVIHKARTTQTTCYGKQQAIADDYWCTSNCTADPVNCPPDFCWCTTYTVNPGEKCSLPEGSQTPWMTIPVLGTSVIAAKKICDQDTDGCNCIYEDMSSSQSENWRYHLYRNSPGTNPGVLGNDISFKK